MPVKVADSTVPIKVGRKTQKKLKKLLKGYTGDAELLWDTTELCVALTLNEQTIMFNKLKKVEPGSIIKAKVKIDFKNVEIYPPLTSTLNQSAPVSKGMDKFTVEVKSSK